MKLKDKIAVVTGGGSGIGSNLCRVFAAEGAQVAVTDIDLKAAEKVAKDICSAGGKAAAWAMDVCDSEEVNKVAQNIAEIQGRIDIWVNNAGVSYILPFLECSDEVWNKTIAVNLTGTFNGCRAALKQMSIQKAGCIINMGSQSGKQGNTHYAAYCASKFGVVGITQSLALEFAPLGIRVNTLCPGVVMTPLWNDMLGDYAKKRNLKEEEVIPYMESKIPLGRLTLGSDVSATAVFLASGDASYITGQSINVSGGVIMN